MTRYAFLAAVFGLMMAAPSSGQEANPVVALDTSLGMIRLELFADKAPATVKNFLRYVDDKFYDGTIFHRVIANFMIQGGGLNADLHAKPTRAPIRNEAGNGLSNVRGTIAMARTSDPNSATAQFFINVKDNTFLDRARARDNVGYTVFGRVTEGLEVVEKIRRVQTGQRGMHADVPLEAVRIRSLRRAAELTVVLGGSFAPAKLFSVAAYVDFPVRGQTLTLKLSPGVVLVEGKEIQPVPAATAGTSLVLWKARVLRPGAFAIQVQSSTGLLRSHRIQSLDPNAGEPGKRK